MRKLIIILSMGTLCIAILMSMNSKVAPFNKIEGSIPAITQQVGLSGARIGKPAVDASIDVIDKDQPMNRLTQEIHDLEMQLANSNLIHKANARELSTAEEKELEQILEKIHTAKIAKIEYNLSSGKY